MKRQIHSNVAEAIPGIVELNYEVKRHAQVFSEIGTLNYDDFQKCLAELNDLFVYRLRILVGFNLEMESIFENVSFSPDRANVWTPAENNWFSRLREEQTQHFAGRQPFKLHALKWTRTREKSKTTNF